MSNVGKNIKKLRKEKNITQDQLAEQLHVTRQAVSNWEIEKTQPDIETLSAGQFSMGSSTGATSSTMPSNIKRVIA